MDKHRIRLVLAVAAVSVVALFVANLADYLQFRLAVARANNLTPSDCLALADFCRAVTTRADLDMKKLPAAFHMLAPLRVGVAPNLTQVLLYERGDVYLWLWIETSQSNQQIHYFTNSTGPQKGAVVWNRNPEFIERTAPKNRLVTITQWSMSQGRHWIVLPDRILAVDSYGTEGSEDTIVTTATLGEHARAAITAALRKIGPNDRGKHRQLLGVFDGISLNVRFSPDGAEGPEDIMLDNVWDDSLASLIDAINRNLGERYVIRYAEILKRDPDFAKQSVRVMNLQEANAYFWGRPKTPWWSVWRHLVY